MLKLSDFKHLEYGDTHACGIVTVKLALYLQIYAVTKKSITNIRYINPD